MTRTYEVFGSREMTPEELKVAVEQTLKMAFESHESSYMGGKYFSFGDARNENFRIHRNLAGAMADDEEEELIDQRFIGFASLLEVNRTERGDELRELLERVPGLAFLARDEV